MLLTPESFLTIGNVILRISGIILGALIILRLFSVVVNQAFIPRIGSTFSFDEKRARTITGLLKSIVRYLIYFITMIMVLQELKVDTTSIVAGAGIVGLALGVGAQSLIRDFITGFFIILENQFAVGDYIVCADMSGTVEEIGLRVTKLRDANGVLHIIPHGGILRVSNYTRGHMQAVVDIPVAYEEDLSEVLPLLEGACHYVGKNMEEILEGPRVVGIVKWQTTELHVRIVANTRPLEQTKVETELRYRIKSIFDDAKISRPSSKE